MIMPLPKAKVPNMTEDDLVTCENCSRTFFPNRLEIHKKSCKSGKPLKAKGSVKVEGGPNYLERKMKETVKEIDPNFIVPPQTDPIKKPPPKKHTPIALPERKKKPAEELKIA